jgi:DNA-binding LacI/PurR family transcriptional regulator
MTDDAELESGKRPSIKDVAARAGVSWRTVSNVIHGHRYLRPETKAKVETAIAELGYKPQIAARQLRSGKSNLITLAVPYIAHPYFSALAHAVVEEAAPLGYVVLVDETRGIREKELQVARGYRSVLTDGIIFSPLTLGVDELLGARDSTPLVLLGEHTLNPQIDHVTVDNAGSVREATAHLIAAGRTRIAFLGYLSQGTLGTSDLRLAGYRDALAAAGITPDPALIIGTDAAPSDSGQVGAESDYSREEGYSRARLIAERRDEIDAVVCANDLLAMGVLRRLRESGIGVPDDIAVVGWDNSPEGAYAAPALTTVAPDMNAIARFAVETIQRRIDDPHAEPIRRIAPHRLLVRGSSADRPG